MSLYNCIFTLEFSTTLKLFKMEYVKFIDKVHAEGIRLAANKAGFKVSFKNQSEIFSGHHIIVKIHYSNIDSFLLFSRNFKGLNQNPHIFSNFYISCSGAIKRIKRVFKKGYYYNGIIYYSISDLKASGINQVSKKWVISQILYGKR